MKIASVKATVLTSVVALLLMHTNCIAETTPDTTSKNRPKVVLALGGGGTRGAAHVGVLRVFEQEGIPIDYIVGTSMGAIVGGTYSAGVPLATLEERFNDGSLMGAFMTVPLWVRLAAAPILLTTRIVHHPYDGLYKGNKFRKYLDRLTPAGKIEDLKIPFRAVVTNVVDGKAYPLSSGDLGYALQASSAVPGLRKPVQIGDKLYVDGGIVSNVPVDIAKQLGGDIVIAVDVDERIKDVPIDTFRKIGSISRRTILLQLANSDAPQIAKADIVIHPDVDGIGLVSTNKADARRAVQAGEEAARKAIPAIRAKLGQTEVLSSKPGNQ